MTNSIKTQVQGLCQALDDYTKAFTPLLYQDNFGS